MEKITVSAEPLRQLLLALNGPGHHIRELQATRGPLVGESNPINALITEYNQAVVAHNAAETSAEAASAQSVVALDSSVALPLTSDELFTQWLAREMPANTIIGDPAWWAPRIKDAFLWAQKTGLSEPFSDIKPEDLECQMTAEEFEECVKSGAINSDDGSGCWATRAQCSPLSVFGCDRPEWATHVMWFNR